MPSSNARASLFEPEAPLEKDGSHDAIDEKIAALSARLGSVADRDFLTEYALAACETVGADIFMIGRLNPYSNLVRSVRLAQNGAVVEDAVTYSLDGTPCERAAESGVCTYKDGVAASFPRDRMLKEFGVEGYAGTALKAPDGRLLGVLVALTKAPIEDERLFLSVLEYFHDRAAAAVELHETKERHDWVVAEATDGVWDWDMVTGGVTVSENLKAKLGAGAGEVLDLFKIENAIHPDDKARHTDALHGHLKNNTPYNLKLRLRNRAGDYRWHHARGKAKRNAAGRPVRMIACLSDIHDMIVAESRN